MARPTGESIRLRPCKAGPTPTGLQHAAPGHATSYRKPLHCFPAGARVTAGLEQARCSGRSLHSFIYGHFFQLNRLMNDNYANEDLCFLRNDANETQLARIPVDDLFLLHHPLQLAPCPPPRLSPGQSMRNRCLSRMQLFRSRSSPWRSHPGTPAAAEAWSYIQILAIDHRCLMRLGKTTAMGYWGLFVAFYGGQGFNFGATDGPD